MLRLHQLLVWAGYRDNILTNMALDDKLVVFERALAQVSVMFVIVIVRLTKEVLGGKHVIDSNNV